MQPRHQATLTQPFQCDQQTLNCKTQKNYAQRRRKLQLQNRIFRRQSEKKTILKHFLKGTLKRKNYEIQLQKTIVTQPRQCDLQPQSQETQRTTHTERTHSLQNTEEEPIRGWNDRSRNRRTQEVPFIAGCNHFTRKNAKFRAPASSPSQAPCNVHAAITMHCAASRSTPASLYAHGNTRWQQSCSHSNKICSHRCKKRRELRTQEQTLVAEHRGGTDSRMKPPQPQPPHTGGTFHRRLQPLYMEKHKVSCSGFLPNTGPMQRSCGHHNAFCSMTWQTRVYLRTWQHQMTTIMQPFQCDLRPQIPETQRTTHTETTTRCRTQRRNQFADKTTAAATAAHRRYLSSPAPSTLHGKTQSFVLPLPPQNRPHVTFMQPFQCDLQPQIQETQRTTHTETTTRCRTQRRNQFADETTAAATAAHRRYLLPPAATTLHGKTQGFVLRLPPQNRPHKTFM